MIFIKLIVYFKETVKISVQVVFLSQNNQIMRGEGSMFHESSKNFLLGII